MIGGRSAHQRGDPALISPTTKTAIRKKGLRDPLYERHSDLLRSCLNITDGYEVLFESACVVTCLGRQTWGRRFGFAKTPSPPMGGHKNEPQPYLLPFGIPYVFLKWSRLAEKTTQFGLANLPQQLALDVVWVTPPPEVKVQDTVVATRWRLAPHHTNHTPPHPTP